MLIFMHNLHFWKIKLKTAKSIGNVFSWLSLRSCSITCFIRNSMSYFYLDFIKYCWEEMTYVKKQSGTYLQSLLMVRASRKGGSFFSLILIATWSYGTSHGRTNVRYLILRFHSADCNSQESFRLRHWESNVKHP